MLSGAIFPFLSYEELEQQHKYSNNMQFEGYQRPSNGEYSLNRQFQLCMEMYWLWQVLVVEAELSNKAFRSFIIFYY